jgi:hypothetical protein
MTSADFDKLLHATSYWLSYQDKIGRSFMIKESSLKYPFADYLTGLKIPIDDIKLEHLHPDLKKRNLDLVTIDPSSPTSLNSGVEFKVASSSTKYEPEQQRIFNDLMRVYLLTANYGTSGYFVVFGKQADYIQFFRSIESSRPTRSNASIPDPKGFYTKWFGFKKGETVKFDVSGEIDFTYKDLYHKFSAKYKSNGTGKSIALPKEITTKCLAHSTISNKYSVPYVGGIWSVS